ncbi:MAG: hypothetical protein IKC40_09095 [Oscillospiraceae bacterium]|nr:hypothetical protein [Oscillospiraceae bacterium]
MKKSCFLFLLLITLTGCSDTVAYSPERATIMQTETTAETTQNSQITAETQATTLPPETVTSTESTPETVPESFLAATESEATTQPCAVYAKLDTSFILTEAKEAETTQETAVYTETTAVQETTVQTTIPPETTTITTTTTIPEITTQTTTAPPQTVDMNDLSPQMWVFLTEYGIDHDTLYMKGQGYSGSELDRAAAALADANAMGGRNCIEYALNAYFLYDGAGLDCGIAFASYDGWYGHVVNVVKIDGIWREFDASAGKYADNTASIIEAFDLYENRIQLN